MIYFKTKSCAIGSTGRKEIGMETTRLYKLLEKICETKWALHERGPQKETLDPFYYEWYGVDLVRRILIDPALAEHLANMYHV